MARRKRKQNASAAGVAAGLPVIRRQDDVLEPVYEADPDGRPVVHHRTVDTLGIMLRAGTITREMHDAARDFPGAVHHRPLRRASVCMPLRSRSVRVATGAADLTETQVDARRRVGRSTRMLWAGSAVQPAPASGTLSACSARSASGRCGRAGAAGRSRLSRRRAF